MKNLLVSISTFTCIVAAAQNNTELFSVKLGQTIEEAVPVSAVYRYPQFKPGQVIFKSGKVSWALLNYNLLACEVQFVNAKNDTASLANEETIRVVSVGADSFYYDKKCYELYSSSPLYKLAVQHSYKIVNREKITVFGMADNTSSIDSYRTFGGDGQWYRLAVRENLVLGRDKNFFISDKFNHFVTLNKKNLLNVFHRYRGEVDGFLRSNSINLAKEQDISKLASFLNTLSENQ